MDNVIVLQPIKLKVIMAQPIQVKVSGETIINVETAAALKQVENNAVAYAVALG